MHSRPALNLYALYRSTFLRQIRGLLTVMLSNIRAIGTDILVGDQTVATLSGTELPEAFRTLLVSIRQNLHMHPELGFSEHRTSQFIRGILEMHGLRVRGPVAGTGLYVDIDGVHPGQGVGYRSDIDALPIQDAKDVDYASRNPGVAHLCGHDVHTSIAIGVALLLDRCREQIHGRIRVFFQPNEEGFPSGAPRMISDGVLDGLEAAYAIHVDPTLPFGKYGLIDGAVTASADRFQIHVLAPATGHSARPHESIDTIWIATKIMNALYQVIGRISDARRTAILTICQIGGGTAHNVIPNEVQFSGTLRCTFNEDRQRFQEIIANTARQHAALYHAGVKVDFDWGSPPVINDKRLVQNVRSTVQDVFDASAAYDIPLPSMGAEDFAHYLEHVPGALIRTGTSSGPATSFPLHNACFDVDEDAIIPTVRLISQVLLNHLKNPPLI